MEHQDTLPRIDILTRVDEGLIDNAGNGAVDGVIRKGFEKLLAVHIQLVLAQQDNCQLIFQNPQLGAGGLGPQHLGTGCLDLRQTPLVELGSGLLAEAALFPLLVCYQPVLAQGGGAINVVAGLGLHDFRLPGRRYSRGELGFLSGNGGFYLPLS